jgi:hypothetical protein
VKCASPAKLRKEEVAKLYVRLRDALHRLPGLSDFQGIGKGSKHPPGSHPPPVGFIPERWAASNRMVGDVIRYSGRHHLGMPGRHLPIEKTNAVRMIDYNFTPPRITVEAGSIGSAMGEILTHAAHCHVILLASAGPPCVEGALVQRLTASTIT